MATRTKNGKVDALEKAFENLARTLTERSRLRANIQDSPDNFIHVPKHMTPEEAGTELLNYSKSMEKEEAKIVDFPGHTDDTLVAIKDALELTFGEVLGQEQRTFFGLMPGKTVSIKVDYNETVKVPVESISVPGLDRIVKIYVEYAPDKKNPMNGLVRVHFTFKRKYAPIVEDIEKAIRDRLENHSIFRSKSISSAWEFINLKSSVVKNLVYAKQVERDLRAHIYSIIDHRERILASGDTIKRTILLSGDFGTGKTLTALAVAMYANKVGWTFYLVRTGDSLVDALKFAKRFQPCIVFVEDVDTETSGERTTQLNDVLNTVDGATEKDDQILLLLTTNHPERISKGMFRPGRIDWEIDMNILDPQSVRRLIEVYGGDMIEGPLDEEGLWAAGGDYVHAFITGSVHSAKQYAMADGREKINNADIVDALNGMRPQWRRMKENDYKVPPTVDTALRDLVQESANGGNISSILEEMRDRLEDVHEHVS